MHLIVFQRRVTFNIFQQKDGIHYKLFSRPFLAPKYTENMEQQQKKLIDIQETSGLYNEGIFFY